MLFFFNDTATTEIYTLSLHDALPIFEAVGEDEQDDPPLRLLAQHRGGEDRVAQRRGSLSFHAVDRGADCLTDRKSTRLNSSHSQISYAVFCLKKKKKKKLKTKIINKK